MFPLSNYVILFIILIVLGFFYQRMEDKRHKDSDNENYQAIQKYLLSESSLGKSKKPIMWIHVPYEYNARNWLSFGSRSSFELNQPYLYLTVKSIIQHCEESFNICLIDDNSFDKLIPQWKVNISMIGTPISDKLRSLALTKLVSTYGGMIVPISFVCKQDLIGLYEKGTQNDDMFVCEKTDRNITSTTFEYYPSISFMGAKKDNKTVEDMGDFIERVISGDFTAQSDFLGEFDRWCEAKASKGKIVVIDGAYVGTKNVEGDPILLEDLMSDNYIKLSDIAYGIWIPANEILNRRHYEWFARLSAKQVLESNTIIGKYLLLANIPMEESFGTIRDTTAVKNRTVEKKYVGWWPTASAVDIQTPVWGLMPQNQGNMTNPSQYPIQ